jgi:RecB family exonuclease
MIKTCSYSRLTVFEHCPHRAKLAFVDKLPEPPTDPTKESPLDRGTRIHVLAEKYVRGDLNILPMELEKFDEAFELLRELYEDGKVAVEELWCYDDTWELVPNDLWKHIWLRIKGDAVVFGEDDVTLIDFKTGKRERNEVKHFDQVGLYALAASIKYPHPTQFNCELWYLDHGEATRHAFSRFELQKRFAKYNERLQRMTSATQFPPKPNIHTCRFCPYKTGPLGKSGQEGTGACNLNPV